MSGSTSSLIRKVALAVVAAGLVYAVVSSLQGQLWTVQSIGGSPSEVRQFNPASLLPIIGAAMALSFAWKGDTRLVWVTGVGLLVISGLFLFSLILVFAPTALAVTASAALLTLADRREQSETGLGP